MSADHPTTDEIIANHDFRRAAKMTETWNDPREETPSDRSAKALNAYLRGQIATLEALGQVVSGETQS